MIFFSKKCSFRTILRILGNKLQWFTFSNYIYQSYANYGKARPLPSTFSQQLPIYQICVAIRDSLLGKVVFFFSARIRNFTEDRKGLILTDGDYTDILVHVRTKWSNPFLNTL